MNWFLNNISILSFLFAIINIIITVWTWYYKRPNLEFYEHDIQSFFTYNKPQTYKYYKSACTAFIYLKIANKSDTPCTISEITLFVPGYTPNSSSGRVPIRDDYPLSDRRGIHGKSCLQLPLTIQANNYVEGYAVFPYAEKYIGPEVVFSLEISTPRKKYFQYGTLHKYHESIFS